ncbi:MULTISPECIES: hypothetical protein [unclassified Streptomyces]|uniref:hypothetical protein n=1 Tax=unclassified Streptomyces TaxID=2593676 RepID=UPI000371581E|nr:MULTISPECIES: hypothetical protein [unclassified Streptomyces]
MPSLKPRHKGQAPAAPNLGAGTFVRPTVAAAFAGPLGVEGVVWIFPGMDIFAGMYAVSRALTLFPKPPDEPRTEAAGSDATAPHTGPDAAAPHTSPAPA